MVNFDLTRETLEAGQYIKGARSSWATGKCSTPYTSFKFNDFHYCSSLIWTNGFKINETRKKNERKKKDWWNIWHHCLMAENIWHHCFDGQDELFSSSQDGD